MKPITAALLLLLLALAAPGWGQTPQLPYPPCRTPVIELRVETPVVTRGTAPSLTLVLRNQGKEQLRLLDIRSKELRDPYSQVTFWRNGRALDLPVTIADPDLIDPRRDYFVLVAGSEIRVTVSDYITDATGLPPNDYEVQFVFWDFPAPINQRCASNRAKFTVK